MGSVLVCCGNQQDDDDLQFSSAKNRKRQPVNQQFGSSNFTSITDNLDSMMVSDTLL